MPSDEPNSKMDELLRAYAKKRREQGEAPGEIHPATRRLLQDEVRRTFGAGKNSAAAGAERWRRWRWPMIATGGGAVAMLLAFAVLNAQLDRLAPAHESAAKSLEADFKRNATKKEPPVLAGRSSPADRSLGLRKTELSEAPLPPPQAPQLAGPRSGENSPMANRYSGTPSTTSPASPAPAAPLAAASPVVSAAATLSTSPAAAPPASAPAGIVTDSLAGGEALPSVQAKAASESQLGQQKSSFQQNLARPSGGAGGASFDSGAQNFVRSQKDSAADPAPNLLSNFRMSRAGRNVSIVDGDGSVYKGTVAENLATEGAAVSRRAVDKTKQPAPATDENWNFNVSGTNRSLQQSIIFSGNVQTLSGDFTNNVFGRNQAGFGGARRSDIAGRNAAASASNAARISGTVQVGKSNQFQIEANQPPHSP